MPVFGLYGKWNQAVCIVLFASRLLDPFAWLHIAVISSVLLGSNARLWHNVTFALLIVTWKVSTTGLLGICIQEHCCTYTSFGKVCMHLRYIPRNEVIESKGEYILS